MEWKESSISELSVLKNGKKRPSTKGAVPVYGGNGIMDFVDSNNQEDAIVIGRVGAYCGCVYFAKGKVWISDNAISVKAKENTDNMFLYYLLNSLNLNNHRIGGAQPLMTQDIIGRIKVSVPTFDTQRRIASILSSLDSKIETNNKINAKLEEMAQALFKSWFVDFEPFKDKGMVESELGMIPEGWRITSLDEMTSKFGTGLNPRKNFVLGEGENFYVTIKNMNNNRVYLDDRCDKVTDEAIEKIQKRSKLMKGDLLFSGIGTIGRVALVTDTPTNWNTSESVFNLHPADNYTSEFLYVLLLSNMFQTYVKINAQGGVQQGIRMASLKAFQMALPSTEKVNEFDALVSPLIAKIKNNDKENDNLSHLRDTLLPKLMSGEIEL